MESKFSLPVPPSSSTHFTLPTYFPQLPGGTINSSHSLPASPSRPPPGFTATPLKFFPIVHGRPSDDLELLKSQRKVIGTIQEVREDEEGETMPPEKRPHLDNHQSEGGVAQQQGGQVLSIPAPAGGVASIPGPPRVQFAQPAGPGGPAGPLQFLPIPLMTSAASHVQPHQNLLGAPLSSFLPQSYFAPRGGGSGAGGGGGSGAGAGGGGAALLSTHMGHIPPPTSVEARSGNASHGSGKEA